MIIRLDEGNEHHGWRAIRLCKTAQFRVAKEVKRYSQGLSKWISYETWSLSPMFVLATCDDEWCFIWIYDCRRRKRTFTNCSSQHLVSVRASGPLKESFRFISHCRGKVTEENVTSAMSSVGWIGTEYKGLSFTTQKGFPLVGNVSLAGSKSFVSQDGSRTCHQKRKCSLFQKKIKEKILVASLFIIYKEWLKTLATSDW